MASDRVESILKRVDHLKSLSPTSPDFIKESIQYPQNKKRWLFGSKIMPDIGDLRESIADPDKNQNLFEARKQLNTLLKKFPFNPDLRVLKAIQIMNDTNQSGLDGKRLDVMKGAVVESAIAIHNNGLSVFNVTWMVKIYLRFLETLQRRVSNEHRVLNANYHWQTAQAVHELHNLNFSLTSMMSLKNQMSVLTNLNARLSGSRDLYDCISIREIQEASQVMLKGKAAMTESGKTGNYILWVCISTGLMFARIPVLHGLSIQLLETIPDISYEIILQKKMIETNMQVSLYQSAKANGVVREIELSAVRLYNKCCSIIKEHLSDVTIFRKPYEVDPFLKAGWIVKEMNGMIETSVYEGMLTETLNQLTTVLYSSEGVKDSTELATQLYNEIETLLYDSDQSRIMTMKN